MRRIYSRESQCRDRCGRLPWQPTRPLTRSGSARAAAGRTAGGQRLQTPRRVAESRHAKSVRAGVAGQRGWPIGST